MTLEEAIKHCEEVAEEQERQADFNSYRYQTRHIEVYERQYKKCLECAKEHRQLAEWLRELKAYKGERVGCEYCKDRYRERHERPCSLCKRNFVDMFEREINVDGEIEEDGE